MKKLIYVLVILVILGAGWHYWTKKSATTESTSLNSSISETIDSSSTSTPTTSNTLPKVVVNMIDTGFVPNTLSIKQGQTVEFVNTGKNAHWPASDLHPTHEIYPEFDPKKPIASGESWSFVFEKIGKWNMHDHMHASFKGSIEVTEWARD